jgi:hypothetical protein
MLQAKANLSANGWSVIPAAMRKALELPRLAGLDVGIEVARSADRMSLRCRRRPGRLRSAPLGRKVDH